MMSIQSDAFDDETLKSDEIHRMRDNNNGYSLISHFIVRHCYMLGYFL